MIDLDQEGSSEMNDLPQREERLSCEAGGYTEPQLEVSPVRLEHQILTELLCPYCQEHSVKLCNQEMLETGSSTQKSY